jgi:hypothetical protein
MLLVQRLDRVPVQRPVPHLPGIQELKTAIAARRGMSEEQRYDELMDASDAVVDLVRSAKLDAAEVATRDLLARFCGALISGRCLRAVGCRPIDDVRPGPTASDGRGDAPSRAWRAEPK